MKPGMRTSSFPGDIEDVMLDLGFKLLPGGGSGVVSFRPAAGYGGRFYALYLNARRERACFVAEGQAAARGVALPPESGPVSIALEDLGDWADASYDPNEGALALEALCAARISLSWLAAVEICPRATASAAAQLSAWSVTGLKRFSNCAPVPGRPARAQLEARLDVAGAQRTVTLFSSGRLVASGVRAGDGAVVLSEENSSGLSGSVDVAASGGVGAGECVLEPRYPRSYEIHHSTGALVFPRAAQQTVPDDGCSNLFRAISAELPAGAHNVAVLSVSDCGVVRGSAASQSVMIEAPPLPPQNPAYDSGGASATTIRWTASATPGATYNIYDSDLNGVARMDAPAATHGAGAGVLTQTLPAIGYPGLRRVLVRAVSGGIEERNGEVLTLEYDAGGNIAGERPAAPRIRALSVSAGRVASVTAVSFAAGQVAPASAQLFLVPEASAIDYAAPVDTQAWGDEVAGVRVAALSAVAPADGFYKVAVRSVSAAGTQDAGLAWERLHIANTEPPAASNVRIGA
jgi:hypothetical protein